MFVIILKFITETNHATLWHYSKIHINIKFLHCLFRFAIFYNLSSYDKAYLKILKFLKMIHWQQRCGQASAVNRKRQMNQKVTCDDSHLCLITTSPLTSAYFFFFFVTIESGMETLRRH